jgi:hypothetical protein
MGETQSAAITSGTGNIEPPASAPRDSQQWIQSTAALLRVKNGANKGPVNIEGLAADLKKTVGKPNHEALKAAVMNSLSAEERAKLQTALQGSGPGNGAGKTAWGGGGASPAPAQAQTAAPPPGVSPKTADAQVQAWTAAARALDTKGSPPSAQAVQAAKEAGLNLIRSAVMDQRPDLIAQARATDGAEAFDRRLKAAGLDPYYFNTTERILSAVNARDAEALKTIKTEIDGKLQEGDQRYFNFKASLEPLRDAANIALADLGDESARSKYDSLAASEGLQNWMNGASAPAETRPSTFKAVLLAPYMTVDQIVTGTIRSVGNAMAITHGPEVSENGTKTVGTFADGSTKELYRNPLNGEYFWANPWDPTDQATADAAYGTAGLITGGRPVGAAGAKAADYAAGKADAAARKAGGRALTLRFGRPKPAGSASRVPAAEFKQSDLRYLGSGEKKNGYALGENQVVTMMKPGGNPAEIYQELDLLAQIRNQGYPTVDARLVTVDGQPAILMDRYALDSKKIVDRSGRKPYIKGDSPYLNERSVADLQRIRELNNKGSVILDLQFLIGKDGHVVVADPKAIMSEANPLWATVKKYNDQAIELLIQQAQKHR